MVRPLAAAVLLGGAACVELSVDPGEIAAIDFAQLPNPSIISGDTLRTASGANYQLVVKVYTSDGALDSERQVTFLNADRLSRVTAARFLVSDTALRFPGGPFTSRVVASVGSLQSVVRQVAIVPRPTRFARLGVAGRDTVFYSAPAVASDTSMSLQVRVGAGTDGSTAVPNYLVAYRLVNFADVPVPATDTSRAFFLIADEGRVTTVDTTDGAGVASRRLRFRIRQGQAAVDSIRVLAEIRVPRQVFPQIEWVIRVQPK